MIGQYTYNWPMVNCILAYHWSFILYDVIFLDTIRCFKYCFATYKMIILVSVYLRGQKWHIPYPNIKEEQRETDSNIWQCCRHKSSCCRICVSWIIVNNGCRIVVDIMKGENCRQFSLLANMEPLHPVGVKGGIVILARSKFHFIRKHENLA